MNSKQKEAKFVKQYFVNLETIVCLYLEYETEILLSKIYMNIKKSLGINKKTPIVLENILNVETTNIVSYIYVMTNYDYMTRNIYKIGYTDNLSSRLSTANTHFTEDNKMFFIFTISCNFIRGNIQNFEDYIHNIQKDFEYHPHTEKQKKKKTEFFKQRFKYIVKILKLIVLSKKKIKEETEILIKEYIDNLTNSKQKYYKEEDELKIFRYIQNSKNKKICEEIQSENNKITPKAQHDL